MQLYDIEIFFEYNVNGFRKKRVREQKFFLNRKYGHRAE